MEDMEGREGGGSLSLGIAVLDSLVNEGSESN